MSSANISERRVPTEAARARKIRAVILDYGEVLCHHPTHEEIQRSARLFHVSPEVFPELFMRNRAAYDRGDLTAEAYWLKFADDTGAKISSSQIEDLRRWDVEMWSTTNAAMMNWVKNLRAAGVKTAILSNMPWDMARHARKTFRWLSNFDCHVFSCEIGEIKPSPVIYRHCLDSLGVQPGDAIFIDDRESNVQGARDLGIHGIRFESSQQLAGALEDIGFSVLPELP